MSPSVRAVGLVSSVLLCFAVACSPSVNVGKRDSGGTGTTDGNVRVDRAPPVCTNSADTDRDGIADSVEGTADTDGDGTPDSRDTDSDNDGIPDSTYANAQSLCGPHDTDEDGVPDYIDADRDNDGLTNVEERTAGTDAGKADTDGDNVTDLAELRGSMTNPLDATSTIAAGDFFVLLPHNGPAQIRALSFPTRVSVADVYFLLDTTASMFAELQNIQNALQTVIIPGVAGLIRDVQFGAGGFADIPILPHGRTMVPASPRSEACIFDGLYCEDTYTNDIPYYHLLDITPFSTDRGAWGPGGPFATVGQLNASPNGTPDILDAVRAYPRHEGANGCESGLQALWHTVTGQGFAWPTASALEQGGSIPAKTCVVGPDDPRRLGYPCFRAGALPIIVYVSDATLKEPLTTGYTQSSWDRYPAPPQNVTGIRPELWGTSSCITSTSFSGIVPAAVPDVQMVRDAIRNVGARLITLSSDDPGNPQMSPALYPARQHMCQLTTEVGSVRADGSPLCFPIGPLGTNLGSDIVMAISDLVGGAPQDVSTRRDNVAGNPDNFDATRFITAVVPKEGRNGVRSGPIPGVTYASKDATTFSQVIPGTTVEFDVTFENRVFPQRPTAMIFKAKIVVVGNRVTDLSERKVFIVVPPIGREIVIF